jgi:hypothetical protein
MPTINPVFEKKILDAMAYAGAHHIDCPPLVGVYNWIATQARAAPVAAAAGTTAVKPSFREALLAAVQSSPQGVGLSDLQAILKTYNLKPNLIAAEAGRQAKAGTIKKAGDLWFFVGSAGSINHTIDQRRASRAGGGGKAAA